jgi:hypothetical protein
VEFFTPDDTTLESPVAEGLLLLKKNQNRWRALLDQQSVAQDWLLKQGTQEMSLTRLTLEDLFVALFQEEEAQ